MFNGSRIDLLEKRVKELQSLLDLQHSQYSYIPALCDYPRLDVIKGIQTKLDSLTEQNKRQEDTIKNLTEAIATQKEREELIEQYKKAGGTVNYKANTDKPVISRKEEIHECTIHCALQGNYTVNINNNTVHTIADFKNILNEQIAKQHKEKCKPKKGKGK